MVEPEVSAALDDMPSWLIGQLSSVGYRLLTARLADEGVRGYHYRLLRNLIESGPISQAELGRRAWIDRSDVVAALDDLTADGLVERRPDPDDKRRNLVLVTAAGKRKYRRLDRIVADVQDEFTAPLTESERRTLVRLLRKLRDHHHDR